MNAQSLEEQRVREQSDSNASADPPPRPQRVEPTDPGPPTVLIFRDQHQQEVQNYAIVGQTLWIFAAQRTHKIPLAELDVDATQKANDERGVDFHMPGANAGQ